VVQEMRKRKKVYAKKKADDLKLEIIVDFSPYENLIRSKIV